MQEATDIYKQLLLENRDYAALNVYVALCYSKLDYFDVSSEILQTYLQQHPNSAAAVNLKACNLFKLYDGKAAETEIQVCLHLSVMLDSINRYSIQSSCQVFPADPCLFTSSHRLTLQDFLSHLLLPPVVLHVSWLRNVHGMLV